MSIWTRVANVFHPARTSRDIDEEFAAHMQQAIDEGRNPEEARKAFGSVLRQREASLDIRLLGSHELRVVLAGAATGLGLALLSARYIESLVYEVKATDPAPLIVPALTLFAATILASIPAAIGAMRIDPVDMLRAE